MAIIEIHSKKYGSKLVRISDEDLQRVAKYNWSIKPSGNTFYAHTNVNNKTITMHRYILDLQSDESIVDHIDGNGLNNTRNNMRIVDKAINARNRKIISTNTSGYAGVTQAYDNKRNSLYWQAKIIVDGKPHSKRFYVSAHGFDEAKEKAIQTREDMEKEYGFIVRK